MFERGSHENSSHLVLVLGCVRQFGRGYDEQLRCGSAGGQLDLGGWECIWGGVVAVHDMNREVDAVPTRRCMCAHARPDTSECQPEDALEQEHVRHERVEVGAHLRPDADSVFVRVCDARIYAITFP